MYCFSTVSDKTQCRGGCAQISVSCCGTAAAPKLLSLCLTDHQMGDATAHIGELICAAYCTVLSLAQIKAY